MDILLAVFFFVILPLALIEGAFGYGAAQP